MNKLLSYADFIHYNNHEYGLTCFAYKVLPFDPVPEHWERYTIPCLELT